jgi:DNA-binding transcriptional ArsR family regulator
MPLQEHSAFEIRDAGDLIGSCASAKTAAMDNETTILALAALAQPTRLEAFRTLVSHEPHGIAAGELARLLGVPQNTLSAHLNVLARGGLVQGIRQSRSIIYRANLSGLRELMAFLVKDCCGGHPDLCEPLLAGLAQPCCPPKQKKRKAAHV